MRHTRIGLLLVLVMGFFTAAAPGQSGWQQTFFRGAEYLGDPNFINRPQGGPLFDNNIFDQRVEYNRTGDGYTYENYRFFGPDSYGNTNTLDLGPLKVQLGLDPNIIADRQPVGIHNRIGYTTRLIPEVFFDTETGQRNFNQFSGQTSFTPVPLNYNVTLHTGVQDFEYTGNALISSSGRINVLGFYDYNLQFTNVGNSTADGVLVHDEQVTDFDTGPINISGNLALDAISSLFQADNNADGAVPTRIASAASAKGKTVDELLADMEAGNKVSDEDMSFLVQQMFIAAFKNDPIGVMTNGMPETVPGFEALSLELTASDAAVADSAAVPEPTLLALMALAALGHFITPRKRRLAC
jgi:hypothetical protein